MCVHNSSLHLVTLVIIIYYIFDSRPTRALYLRYIPDEVESGQQKPTKAQGTPSWAVKIHFSSVLDSNETILDEVADLVASEVDLINKGQVGELFGHYLFIHETYNNSTYDKTADLALDHLQSLQEHIEDKLSKHKHVEWFNQQVIRQRVKRSLDFEDPDYRYQWHLHNYKYTTMDINVTGIWDNGITGTGVTVSVIDDGLEWDNPDILENYSKEGSWDLNSNDADPMPKVDAKGQNHHGTRCAGEIAAVRNSVCGVGVAFNAEISGIRALDGPMTDSLEATAFNKFMQINDIYSCSWGPDDDGETVDGPHPLAKAALQHGVAAGRKGYGNLFVVASGNGGRYGDDCNFDGYANSIYTITIGAVDETGHMPFYAEECASMLAVTFSSGQSSQRSIVTTDWLLGQGLGCTTKHSGTSAAAPLAAGMIALMLEARPCLTWRDVQHIIVMTSTLVDEDNSVWFTNKANFHHSHQHGFGLLNAWRLVNAAKVWHNVPWMTSMVSPTLSSNKPIPATVTYEVTEKEAAEVQLSTLEHVQVTVSISHEVRGDLEIHLICPSGTTSVIASQRREDKSVSGFVDWPFSTVRCWGERPFGLWQLILLDKGNTNSGVLHHWKLTMYGSPMTSNELMLRRYEVEDAMTGAYLHSNISRPCPPPLPMAYDESKLISARTLKILCLVGGFALFMSVYYTVEQAFFNKEDKEPSNTTQNRDEYKPLTSNSIDSADPPPPPPFIDGIPLEELHLSQDELELNYQIARTENEEISRISIENDTNLTVSLPSERNSSNTHNIDNAQSQDGDDDDVNSEGDCGDSSTPLMTIPQISSTYHDSSAHVTRNGHQTLN
ncbi:proprotein convertase subtilisin/kexin type 7-like [Glandiceps talaboti]